MSKLIKDAINDTKSRMDIENMTIVSPTDGLKQMSVMADKHRIMQVISNFLNNAIKYAKPAGTITVKVMQEGDEVKVIVVDTGPGINPEILPRLFQKRVSGARATSGTGLGLFISKAIIEAHGGRIWGDNNSDGKGATFGFSLPVSSNHDPARARESVLTNSLMNEELIAMARNAFVEKL
jgi:signal transduction histidine kinase